MGFLPTSQFWHHAALTPISIVFWVGAAVVFTFFDFFALVWWQQSLVWMVFWWVWAGLVERYTRRYLARRRMRALAGPRTDPPEGLEDATVVAPPSGLTPVPEPPDLPSHAYAPSRTPGSRLVLVQRVESWDLAYERLFGRGAGAAQFAFNLAFGLAIFYPSWIVKLLGILSLLGAARCVGSWERRSLGREQGALPPSSRPGRPTNPSSSGTGAAEPPGRRA
ncbi:hypothetical protein [Nannocystis pusilla]|uniref:Uncharacterized protein n=1 Tax=Nannocystis pusilla TaxID=889268 RepID=A0ABS7TNF7_9BACT|nr:hypothetical protein [Nannocystis pusilla]MBZ5709752.1 hypothetical protein [Nannocystis pusilla]